MDASISFTTLSVLNTRFSRANFTHLSCISPRPNGFGSTPLFSLRAAAPPPVRRRLRCVSSSGNGNGGVRGESGGGGGGGDDGGPDGGDVESKLLAEDDAAMSTDVIVLGVGGMVCGGCTKSVKRILESQPQVSRASVDLASETAVVWPVAEAKIAPNWREELGEALAKHLTTCGFSSKVQGQGAVGGDVSL